MSDRDSVLAQLKIETDIILTARHLSKWVWKDDDNVYSIYCAVRILSEMSEITILVLTVDEHTLFILSAILDQNLQTSFRVCISKIILYISETRLMDAVKIQTSNLDQDVIYWYEARHASKPISIDPKSCLVVSFTPTLETWKDFRHVLVLSDR